MGHKIQIHIPCEKPTTFCQRRHIRKLSLFGSVLRDDLRPDSGIDVLVEFDPVHISRFIRISGMKLELSQILGERPVDLNTPGCLSLYYRDEVLAQAEVQYAHG